jgi:hypothetical protein
MLVHQVRDCGLDTLLLLSIFVQKRPICDP